jgi:biopolymer transport protein ExbD
MGMSSGGGDKKAVQSEINVTPLIDVLLVLLIIFLVVMPIMMEMETLEVPRNVQENEMPDPNASMLTIKVAADMRVAFNDGTSENDLPIKFGEIASTLRPKLASMTSGNEKVVFVEFEEGVMWNDVVQTMDSIRSLTTEANRDEIKVALKIKEEQPGQ